MSDDISRLGGSHGMRSSRWISWLTLAAGAVMCLGAMLLS